MSAKSYKLGYLLFHSSLPKDIKEAWYRLLPSMNQKQLNQLYNLLKKENKEIKKMKLQQNKEWERLMLEHETQLDFFISKQ